MGSVVYVSRSTYQPDTNTVLWFWGWVFGISSVWWDSVFVVRGVDDNRKWSEMGIYEGYVEEEWFRF